MQILGQPECVLAALLPGVGRRKRVGWSTCSPSLYCREALKEGAGASSRPKRPAFFVIHYKQ